MTDLLTPPSQELAKPVVDVAETVSAPVRSVAVESAPNWFQGLSATRKTQIRWVNVADLRVHPACDFIPFYARTYAMVLTSMRDTGSVLFPLATAPDGRVLDGRYRLQASRELGIEKLPTITIDVEGDAAVRWVFEVKISREHLSEHEARLGSAISPKASGRKH